MRLRTTLYLASFFPIFISALFIAYLFTVHLTVVMPGGGRTSIPTTGAIVIAIFALVVGWCFYRAGLKLVRQVAVLEHMTERVQRGDLDATARLPNGRGGIAHVAEVFRQMVVELRGYVELIGAHEKLKRECDAAVAAADRLRASAVEVSGTLELLRRAEQGILTRLLDDDLFLLAWLPQGTLGAIVGRSGNASEGAQPAPAVPPDVLAVLRQLLAPQPAADKTAAIPAPACHSDAVSVVDALKDAVLLCRWTWERDRPQAPITVTIAEGQAKSFDVVAARRDLVQAFTIVLSNAAEAMPEGGAVVVEARADADGTRTISITDNGPGMTAAVRTRCMKPFFSTKEGSLGIGLNLAARLATRCGGRLGVIGEPGKGTTVYLTFPKPVPRGEDGTRVRPQPAFLSVLLVDDDEPARDSLRAMLVKGGHRVTDVEDGARAILLLRKHRFDVVMTDLAMPIMSGEELAIAVKARYPGTPVVLVSGAGEELERRNLMPEGVDVILPKPVLSVDLGLALARAMDNAGHDAAPADQQDAS